MKILTNYLDLAGYGLYSKIYNYLSISVVADLGLYTITREISDHKDDPEKVRSIAGTVLSIRTGMGLAIVVLSLGLAAFLPGYDTLPALVGILIAGVFTLFGLVNSSILSLLQAIPQNRILLRFHDDGKTREPAFDHRGRHVRTPENANRPIAFLKLRPLLFPALSL